MKIFKKTTDEFLMLMIFPTSLTSMIVINPLFLTQKFLFVVAIASSAILYFVIRWAFIDNSGKLGISTFQYWKNRKNDDADTSWTHSSS